MIARHRRRVVAALGASSAAIALTGVALAPPAAGARAEAARMESSRPVRAAVAPLPLLGPASTVARPRAVTAVEPPTALRLPSGRDVYLHLPAGATERPHRLLLVLHGWHLTPSAEERATGLDGYGDSNGLIVAYGSGVGASWNAGTCCGTAMTGSVDDVGYVVGAIRAIEAAYPVVADDVVVAGFSNGGMLAVEAACQRPDVIHAAASVAGPLLTSCPHPVRILHIHGVADRLVPLAGGWSRYTRSLFPSARQERADLPAGSRYALVTWPGVHAWPTAADGCDADALILRLF